MAAFAQVPPAPPVAPRKEQLQVFHGRNFSDPYHWLREKGSAEVLAYLEAENAYTRAVTAPLLPFTEALYAEMLGRIKQTDVSVPYRQNGYFYYTRYDEGKEYPIYCRKKGSLDAREEIFERGRVRRIAREHFVGERQALRGHHQSDHHLHAVRTVIARVAVAALIVFICRWIGFEVRAREIIQEHIEARVEQIPPATYQVIEHGLFVRKQPVVTTVERMDVGKRGIGAKQITERTPLKPVPMQAPLATRRQEPIRHQHKQHLIPTRTFARGRQSLAPELIEPQLLP